MCRRAVCSAGRPSVSGRALRAPQQTPPWARLVCRGVLPRCRRRLLGRGTQDLPWVCRCVGFVHMGASWRHIVHA
eukprot:9325926-Pyramimonas_sp.AAC.1